MKNWFSPKLLCKGFCIIISSWLVFRIQHNMEILIEIFNGSLWYQTCNILFMRWVNQCLHLAANWSLSQWGANFFHLGSSDNQFLLSQQSNIRSFVTVSWIHTPLPILTPILWLRKILNLYMEPFTLLDTGKTYAHHII